MSERALEIRTCGDKRAHGQPEVVKLITTFLLMTAAGVGLVLLFAAQAVMTLWNACASGTRSLKGRMTPMGRNAFHRVFSWRRAIYLFYLGTAASWSSSQASSSLSPEHAFLGADVHAPSNPRQA